MLSLRQQVSDRVHQGEPPRRCCSTRSRPHAPLCHTTWATFRLTYRPMVRQSNTSVIAVRAVSHKLIDPICEHSKPWPPLGTASYWCPDAHTRFAPRVPMTKMFVTVCSEIGQGNRLPNTAEPRGMPMSGSVPGFLAVDV